MNNNWRNQPTAAEAWDVIREQEQPYNIGRQFEDLVCEVARNTPDLEVQKIYPISQWPHAQEYGLDNRDIGVDLIAELTTGETVAIQCKARKESKISKDDIKDFLSGSQNQAFDLRWLISTTDVSDNTRKMFANTNLKLINFADYHSIKINQAAAAQPPRELYPLQQEAVDAVTEGFSNQPEDSGRGQLIMACGTGKTFTALRIAEDLVQEGEAILFLAPSIALVAQARREWLTHTTRRLYCTVICSDSSTERNAPVNAAEISCTVTTTPEKIAASIHNGITQQQTQPGVLVVFCTYQSLPKLIEAKNKNPDLPPFALALIDEAHRTAGAQTANAETRMFQLIHSDENILCRRRLYMTATPRIYSKKSLAAVQTRHSDLQIIDMNDFNTYGTRFFQITFRQAVNAGMLSDVRIISLGLSEDTMPQEIIEQLRTISNQIIGGGKPPELQEILSAAVIYLAIAGLVEGRNEIEIPDKLPATLAYANTIRRSKWLAQILQSDLLKNFLYTELNGARQKHPSPPHIKAVHLDGTHSSFTRKHELDKLNNSSAENTLRVISNVKLFAEGIDVPALNAIAFLDPKSSTIEIIQAIGRVMRKSAGSSGIGYIIAPFSLAKGESVTEALQNKSPRFEILGKVLHALQSHDETLVDDLQSRLTILEPSTNDDDNNSDNNIEAYQTELQLYLDQIKGIHAEIANYTGLGNRGKLVADIIISAVKRAAAIFTREKVNKTLALSLGAAENALDTPSDKEMKSKLNEAANTAALLIVNACLMHKRIEATGALAGLNNLQKLGVKQDVLGTLINDWQIILKKDYKPIFEQALHILQALQDKHAEILQLNTALHILVSCAVDTSESLNDLGYDHAGPLYHTILDNAKSQGAFYTKNNSALLLAQLVFNQQLTDWHNTKEVKKLKIVDPCCGTGTLLMAALNTVKQRATQAQDLSAEQQQLLHKALVENSICGFDIIHHAIQLAACNLTLGEPSIAYNKMQLYTLAYGYKENVENKTDMYTVQYGSLELLLQNTHERKQQTIDQVEKLDLPLQGTNVENAGATMDVPARYDVVVMNPPFTDTIRQPDQFSAQIGDAMSKRVGIISRHLQDNAPDEAAALARRSIRPFFTPLANRLVKLNEGSTLAMIIPTTACSSTNGINERKFLAANFHIETIITSHDPKNIAFSASTGIHESMLIARRKADKSAPTQFIQLARMPLDKQEIEELAERLAEKQLGDWGNIIEWQAEKICAGDWSPVQWYSDELSNAACVINELSELSPVHSATKFPSSALNFRITFDYVKTVQNNANKKFYCSTSERYRQTMASPPDSSATPKRNKATQADSLLAKAGHILVPARLRITSARVMAVYTETPSIGSAYIPVDNSTAIDRKKAKAFTVFLNSSFGILQLLNIRTRMLDYPNFEIYNLKQLKFPTDNVDITKLVKLFDKTKDKQLLRIAQAHKDPLRKELDHAVADIIGISRDETDNWRRLLSEEPTISNKRRT